ncbi:extracellular solute-binding protein [Parafrigoribacterium soli]|uniref:extracellular solute-binding protein n=1 Tax=Parafrigoribacterium soli TaxID=3144663 RepID=UPI0032EAB46F
MVSRSQKALIGLSTIAIVGMLAGCAGGTTEPKNDKPKADNAPATLTFVGYGGVGQDAMIKSWQEPFTADHPNVSFVNTSPPDVAQVKAQVESNAVQWDVMAVSPAAAEQNCGTLFEPLKLADVDQKDLVKGTVGKCYIGNFINASPFAYRTAAFPDASKAPKTIKDFFDVKKFPGKRGILTNLQNGILEYPLLADGVKPKDMYPLDVDRALKKLDTIRSVTTFAPNVGALQQAVGSGQVDMFLLADSRIVPLMNEGTDITVVWDKTVASINGFAIPKGSKNVKAATEFIKSVVKPGPAASISAALGVAPVNLAAKPKLTENGKKLEVFGAANTGETVVQDVAWYAKNFNEVTTKLTNWLAG